MAFSSCALVTPGPTSVSKVRRVQEVYDLGVFSAAKSLTVTKVARQVETAAGSRLFDKQLLLHRYATMTEQTLCFVLTAQQLAQCRLLCSETSAPALFVIEACTCGLWTPPKPPLLAMSCCMTVGMACRGHCYMASHGVNHQQPEVIKGLSGFFKNMKQVLLVDDSACKVITSLISLGACHLLLPVGCSLCSHYMQPAHQA